MFLRQITDAALAQNAYLIGCQRTGEAIIVDPERDLDRYYNFIFVGDVGRPDLLESAAGQAGAMQPAARTLYASLRGTAEIPGHVQILPAHGAGSACGKSLGAVPVSVMTGFLGVGGGFLLVPALVKFARLPLPMATGTSLAIIACNSAAGFAGHLGGGDIDWKLAATFSIIAAAGVIAGGKFASLLPQRVLRRGFALLVMLTAVFVIHQSLA